MVPYNRLIILALLFLSALSPRASYACSCAGLSEDDLLASSDYVFEGYVYHQRFLITDTDSIWGKTSIYIFKNLDIKKGEKRFYVEIHVPPAIGSCEGMHYLKNVKYRISANAINGVLSSGYCASWPVE